MLRPPSLLLLLLLAAAAVLGGGPALAHPHVWITARSELVYGPGGKLAAVRHHWTFDDAYSAFSVQGLDKSGDGKLSAGELAELAKTNIESLADFGYFTSVKANGVKQALGAPRNESLTYDKGLLTLHYEIPLKEPAPAGRLAVLEVYDPTFFIDFQTADGDAAAKLVGAPAGCAVTITRPKPLPVQGDNALSQDFFAALNASTSLQFSTRTLVACP